LGDSERLGVTGLKTGHYKRPLQEAIANAIAKAAAPFAGLQKAPLEEVRASRGCRWVCLLHD
jgi:hypothetical protein